MANRRAGPPIRNVESTIDPFQTFVDRLCAASLSVADTDNSVQL